MRRLAASLVVAVLALGATVAAQVAAPPAGAAEPTDPFYVYSGHKPLADFRPGAVLKTRTLDYHLVGISVPLHVTQLLYRSTNARGQASAAVTSAIAAPFVTTTDKVVAYQSFYDSLNPEDGPSRAIAADESFGGTIATAESAFIVPLLLAGYGVVVADTEGPTADFAAGPEYGMATLDSLKAVSKASGTGISPRAHIGLLGYSGGAIATNWAAALAPAYAPQINRRLVGAAEGGVLVDPDHNLHYIDGSQIWAGVIIMAVIGVARAYGVDLKRYLNAYGRQIYDDNVNASIEDVLGKYPGLTFRQLAKPRYAVPESIPVFVDTVNKVNLGSAASPTVPMFIGQGANGELEGTSGSTPGIGPGDGVMIAGDVRSLARQYCADGTAVTYHQYDLTSHTTSVPQWLAEAVPWLTDRFAGTAAPNNCASIAPGNPLTPVPAP